MPSVAVMPASLATRYAAREAGLLSTSAAVPRSFSVATLPIASRMAVRMPAWPTFFSTWSTASLTVGVGNEMSNETPPSDCTSSAV